MELLGADMKSLARLPPLPSSPFAAAVQDSLAAILLRNGEIALLSPFGGKVLWTGETHIEAGEFAGMEDDLTGEKAEILFDERGIYALTSSGASGFTVDGRRLWFIKLQGAASIPAFGDEGVLFSGGTNWILYAYRLENRSRFQEESLYGPSPAGSYLMAVPPSGPWVDYFRLMIETSLGKSLKTIADAIEGGRVGEEEGEYGAFLAAAAGSLLDQREFPWRPPPVRVPERIEALRLLGYIGSRETIPFLANLYLRDSEPLIKAAAAEAIGRIGVDPEGIAMNAFAALIVLPRAAREEKVLIATAAATGALCRFSGPPLSGAGIKILSDIAAIAGNAKAGLKAREELQTLYH
jgi:outer membrane protein assembly factor BamB